MYLQIKLDESTGDIDLMQSTLDDCLEKSKVGNYIANFVLVNSTKATF